MPDRLRSLLDRLPAADVEASLPDALRVAVEAAREVLECRNAAVNVFGAYGTVTHFVLVSAPRRPDAQGRPTPRAIDPRSVGLPARHPPIRSLLGVPIRAGADVLGGLFLSDPLDGREFSADDESVARVAAAALAALVDRARLTAHFLQRQRWYAESADLTRSVLSGVHPDPLQLLADRVLELADADVALVAHAGEKPDTLDVVVGAGRRARGLRGLTVPGSAAVSQEALASGQAVVIGHHDDGDEPNSLTSLLGADAGLVVPLGGQRGRRNVLGLGRRQGRPMFTADEIEVASMFAGQMALALDLAESRAHREHAALLDERDRIARDLHDHVIQQLFAIGMSVQSTGTGLSDEAAARLNDTVAELDNAINQIRTTIHRLTGPITASRSFVRVQAERLVAELTPVLGFTPELQLRGPVDFGLDEDVTDDCVAVLREALSNVARHARATRSTIAITVSAADLTLEVLDDGSGIGDVARRSGLANLRTRAERRGGTLTVTSAPGAGTHLIWTIPLHER